MDGVDGQRSGEVSVMANWPTQQEADAYVAARAPSYGIDPSVAVTVRRGESENGFVGDHGSSFGPLQLHIGGGLGDVFKQQTGLDPADPRNWQASTDFGLRWASRHGWQDFHGAQRAGVGIWDGIGRAASSIGQTLSYYFPIVGYSGDPSKTYHTPGATDLFSAIGTGVRNIVQGRVVATGTSGPGGNNILIHGDDGRDYYYAHLKDAVKFDVGQFIPGGMKIGEVGNTGNAASTQPHLHVGIGYGIQSGTGPTGGTGVGFDAQSFLSNLLHIGGAKEEPIISATTPVSPGDVMGSVKGGITGALDYVHQGIINYVQDRAASMVLLVAGVFLVLIGVWQFANRVPIIKESVSAGREVLGAAAMVA